MNQNDTNEKQQKYSQPSFNELWNLNNFVTTNSNKSSLIKNNKEINGSVKEKFIYYHKQENILLMINDWQSKINKKNLLLDIQNYDVDMTNKPLIDQSNINKIRLVKLYKPNSQSIKKKLLLCAGTHAREIATLNIVIKFIDDYVYASIANDQSKLKIFDKFDIHIIINQNPIGMFIDGATTIKINNNYYNVPGVLYRKNGANMDNSTFNIIKTFGQQNISLFSKNPDVNMAYGGGKTNYFVGHKHLEANKQYNKGVDLNRNCAKPFSYKEIDNNAIIESNIISNTSSNNSCWFDCSPSKRSIEYDNENMRELTVNWIPTNDKLSSTYPGDIYNSESETKIFENIFDQIQPDIYITIHSYSNKIIPCDIFIDNDSKTSIYADSSKSIPSKYTLSKFIKDMPYFQQITKNTNIDFIKKMSPIGIAKGDHTHYAYVATNKLPKFISFTLEMGSSMTDGFYPSHLEMISILTNSTKIITNSINYFN